MASLGFALPILAGKIQEAETLARTVREYERLDEVMGRLGITRETWWIQESAQGDTLIAVFEASNPIQVMQDFANAQGEFEMWEKAKLKEVTGIDFSHPPTTTELPRVVWDYRGRS